MAEVLCTNSEAAGNSRNKFCTNRTVSRWY